eukprot:TRINITY_DN29725_c0_g1_i2.p1 TRINITY_DN29725_c0_g1~~TRINITY_DN29725_c0_g1_i2.p1  ORF type:complete len:482 (-),score=131.52 TRINITY_DN29725_c0_g1_i2:55-1500(-)
MPRTEVKSLACRCGGYADMCGNGTDAGRAGEDAGSVVSLHRQLNSKRMAVVTLEAELQRYTDRLRYSMVVAERQKRDRGGLRDDTVLQAKKKQAAHSRLQEEATKLENMEQELDELSRRCKTEELRAAMLREAFEQEQSRVGESLGRAEAFVSDLVAATEDTRKFEVEEQAMSRECIQALSHIRAERAEDEAVVEGRASTLRSELEESQRYLQLKSGSGAAAANAVGGQDRAEAQKHAAHNELLHMRERYEAAMLSAQTWSQEALDLKWRFNHLRRKDEETREEIQQLLGGGQLSVEDRLLLLRQLLATAEAEEVRLLLAQARVAEETAIMKARKSPDAVPDWQHLAAGRLAAADSDSEALAQLHVRSLGEALAELRSSSFPDLAAAETEELILADVGLLPTDDADSDACHRHLLQEQATQAAVLLHTAPPGTQLAGCVRISSRKLWALVWGCLMIFFKPVASRLFTEYLMATSSLRANAP